MGISTKVFRYIAAAVVFLTNSIGSIGPIFVTAPKWTSRLESLAGGVFMAAGLAHLLADSNEELEHVHGLNYPLSAAICLAVFVLFTLIELFTYTEHDAAVFSDHHHHHTQLETEGLYDSIASLSNAESVVTPKIVQFGSNLSDMDAATISLYLMMCLHSSIEGLALGVLDEWTQIIAVFCAVIAHKPVEGFALSLIILKKKPPVWFFVLLVVIYVFLCPLALIIGVIVMTKASHLALGLIEAFSSGTFLFVGCHEWCDMFEHKHQWKKSEKIWHFGLFAFGVLWMLLVAIIEMYSGE
jgi:zinc transporter 1/2/3